jgi:hypothetical protein
MNKEFTREDSFNRSGRAGRRAQPRSMQLIQRHSSHACCVIRICFGTRLVTRTGRDGRPFRRGHDRHDHP